MRTSGTQHSSALRRWLGQFLLAFVAAALILSSRTAFAQSANDDPRFNEVWKKSQELRDQPAIDTTPVEFTFLGVKYRVPRNYIVHMPGPLTPPTFRVTFPGFEPLTEKTGQCLTQPRAYWPPGCVQIEFWLEGPAAFSGDQLAKNEQKWLKGKTPQKGPDGFEVYDDGAVYRKKTATRTLWISCIYVGPVSRRSAVCSNDHSLLPNGNGLTYRIDLNQIENAERIDDGIRALIDSFTLKGDKP